MKFMEYETLFPDQTLLFNCSANQFQWKYLNVNSRGKK